jgi:integrase
LGLVLALNASLRDKESRELRWEQIDMVDKKTLVVGQSKTDAGTGRVIPLNGALLEALLAHAAWYTKRFKECKPEWFVFAFGRPLPCDPTRHATTFKTVWTTVRANSAVSGRWHDNRHTLVTELAESGAGDEVIMSIAGHVSRQMLSRYSHVRNEAKRKALEEIYARQTAAEAATRKRLDAQAQHDGARAPSVATALPIQ